MWAVYLFIGYVILALTVPTVLAMWPTWRRARVTRKVVCPASDVPALITLDPWYAVRMHVIGDSEVRVKHCERWPERRDCDQECLTDIGTAV